MASRLGVLLLLAAAAVAQQPLRPPVRAVVGSEDPKEVARVIFRSPPNDPYILSNFRQGTLSLTDLSHHLLVFAQTPAQIPLAHVGEEEVNGTVTSERPGVGPVTARFREIPRVEPVQETSLLYQQLAQGKRSLGLSREASSHARFQEVAAAVASAAQPEAQAEEDDDFVLSLLQTEVRVGKRKLEDAMQPLGESTYMYSDSLRISGVLKVETPTPIIEWVAQWALVALDDFETDASVKSWSDPRATACVKGGDRHLGGYCNFDSERVNKTYKFLPPHRFVRVRARFHFLDKWMGEMAMMELNKKIVWTSTHHHCPKIMTDSCRQPSFCGDDSVSDIMSAPIDVTIAHTASELEVAFSSQLQETKCEASYGIDDVMIFLL